MDYLLPGERFDELQRNGYRIIQNPAKFCFGMDAVLLSGFARAKRGERVLDLGTGTGIIPILMAAKTDGEHFTGLEIQEESADMAARSVACNGLQQKIDIVNGDIKEASGIFGAASFDVVTTNPPYMTDTHGLKNPDMPKAIARHEVLCTLDDVVREGAKVLKPGGRFYMVHRPFRLVEIFQTMTKYKLEPKRMKLVYPMADREPNMVLIEGIRGAKSMIKIEKVPSRNDSKIGHAVGEIILCSRCVSVDGAEYNIRVQLAEIRQNLCGKIWQQDIIVDKGDLMPAGLGELSDIIQCALINVLDGASTVYIYFSGISQVHFVLFTCKELCVEAFFDPFQLSAQRRLREEQTVCSL
mgnify:CR=1 FL=1